MASRAASTRSLSAAAASMHGLSSKTALRLRAMGFCGADDSVAPSALREISARHPWVEWGVLFRADLQGTPRYASWKWLDQLKVEVAKTSNEDGSRYMRTAAHLCGNYVEDLLSGDPAFAARLHSEFGFNRIQVNPTAANNVDSSNLAAGVEGLKSCLAAVPGVEFIVQVNDETADLWTPLSGDPPENMAFLFDESKGLGKLPEVWPTPYSHIPCGFAGGLGPTNIERPRNFLRSNLQRGKSLTSAHNMTVSAGNCGPSPIRRKGGLPCVAPPPLIKSGERYIHMAYTNGALWSEPHRMGRPLWVDMESSLRSIVDEDSDEPQDIFDLDKCLGAVAAADKLQDKYDVQVVGGNYTA